MGTAPPRRCGIATFTDDLRQALAELTPTAPPVEIAMTESGSSYDYGPEVVYEIRDDALADYRAAAELVNASDVEVVSLQHEFGIFGGAAGRHVIELLDHLRAPVVTTLHTVVSDPPPEILAMTRQLAERSDRLVVLAEQALELLRTAYGIDTGRTRVIPHGVPATTGLSAPEAKRQVGASDRTLLLTFGLLGPDKGIELMIDALPRIVAADPTVLYVVLGATHPHVVRDHGEAYRQSLERRVGELGLTGHVAFVDRYVDLDELRTYLAATDVYITPYRGAEQIVSGTLAYAMGLGLAIVSTPYLYALELLRDGCGEIVPFGDTDALAVTVGALVADPARRDALRRRAGERGRRMSWPAVAGEYERLFGEVVAGYQRRPREWRPQPVPAVNLAAIRAITDDTGLFQHGRHGVPTRSHGYCTDDVARALVVAVQASERGDAVATALVPTYLSFLAHAQLPDGRFQNLLAYDRRFVPETESEDTLGQAIWGLGATIAATSNARWRGLAVEIFDRSVPVVGDLHHTKAAAYALVGLHGHLQRFPGAPTTRRTMRRLATALSERLAAARRPGWLWFDDALTYGNAKVPEALLLAGTALEEPCWVEVGCQTLDFLLEHSWRGPAGAAGTFDFVGNEDRPAGAPPSPFGQQPIEAAYTAQACALAFEITGRARYADLARAAVEWLLGRNRLGLALYDPATGVCADGLDRHGPSSNAGGESLVCGQLALLAYSGMAGTAAVPAVLERFSSSRNGIRLAPTATPIAT